MSASRPETRRRSLGFNVAILTGLALAPVVAAAGFLADSRTQAGVARARSASPELRGTFDPASPSPG